MKASEIRKKYLDFFITKNHKVIPSASLIKDNRIIAYVEEERFNRKKQKRSTT